MDANGIVELHPVGDVELWFAEPDDCSWRLPLYVEWKENPSTKERYGLVIPPFCFYESQLMTIEALVKEHSLQMENSRWLLGEKHVQSLLRKAPGIHADFYYKWAEDERPPVPSTYRRTVLPEQSLPDPARVDGHREFATYVAKERHLPDDVVMTVINAITQLGARWMIEHRKTLDLGFVKLVAMPFRVNWKENLTWKCKPWQILRVLLQPAEERDRMLRQCEFSKSVCSTHNVALKLKHGRHLSRVDYTVEVIQTNSFERVAEEVERDRMKAGQTSYVAHFEEAVETLYERIIEVMVQYAHKINAPWATVRAIGQTGIMAFLPVGRYSHKVRGLSLANVPAHIVPPRSNFSVFAEAERQSDEHLVSAQAAEMQKVPPLPPRSWHLRKRKVGGSVDEPRPEGTDGLPVLDASQGAASG